MSIYVVCIIGTLIPTLLVGIVVSTKYKVSLLGLIPLGIVQVTIFFFLLKFGLSGLGDAAYFGAGFAVIVGSVVLSSVFGVLVYPLQVLLIYKPDNWKNKSKKLVSCYLIAVILILSPLIVKKMGIGKNVDLYGKVVDINGKVVPGASVFLENCPYYKDNPTVTDENGIFRVEATCGSYLYIKQIHNPITGTSCQSKFHRYRDPGDEILVFDNFTSKETLYGRPHWVNYGVENPFVFSCVWHKPDNIKKRRDSFRNIVPDGRIYSFNVNRDKRKERLFEGVGEGQMKVQLYLDPVSDPSHHPARSGWLKLTPYKGGIQIVKNIANHNIAPPNGYTNEVFHEFQDEVKSIKNQFYFNSNNSSEYGVISFSAEFNYSRNSGTSVFNMEYIVNSDGERALTAHDKYFE